MGPGPSAPLPVLMNPAAGAGIGASSLADRLRSAGVPVVVEPVEPARLAERLRSLAGRPRLGVAGGDGTLRTAAELLRGSSTVLVPIPTGTLNHFARRLGLGDPVAALRDAAGGSTRTVALGVISDGEDHVFLDTAIVGAYPAVVRIRTRLRAWLGKWPAAALGLLVVWLRWPRIDLVVRTERAELRRRTAMLWIGTGPGTFPWPHRAPLARTGDGLEVVLLPDGGRVQALRLLRAIRERRRGRSPESAGLEVLHATEVHVDAQHGLLHLTLDAEPLSVRSPIRAWLDPAALRVPDGSRAA